MIMMMMVMVMMIKPTTEIIRHHPKRNSVLRKLLCDPEKAII